MCLRAKYAHLHDDSHLGEGSRRRRVFQRIKWMQAGLMQIRLVVASFAAHINT